jgi:Domain of unknown function (DUF397)
MIDPRDPLAIDWRTSSHSTSGNQCVEVGRLPTNG